MNAKKILFWLMVAIVSFPLGNYLHDMGHTYIRRDYVDTPFEHSFFSFLFGVILIGLTFIISQIITSIRKQH